ncbi:hypothetical protein GF312_17430 [Candidatus Poribacteria bacterium]|nr:hypothetical protein [Candidatus Poribacteria bacterium]
MKREITFPLFSKGDKRGILSIMKNRFLFFTILILTFFSLNFANAGDWIDNDEYSAPTGTIEIDGNDDDWMWVEKYTDIEFLTANGDWTVFEEYNGGVWEGPEDHTTSVAFAWDEDYLYMYAFVIDDEHQNNNSWFDGDAVQVVIADNKQATVTQLYNYALTDGVDNILIGNETATAGGLQPEDVAIVRDDDAKTTFYEARYSSDILGLKGFEEDMQIGVGICVNDGDADTPGQKGWSGWGPHAAVFGKNAEKTGLVTLSSDPIAVGARDKLTTTWGSVK